MRGDCLLPEPGKVLKGPVSLGTPVSSHHVHPGSEEQRESPHVQQDGDAHPTSMQRRALSPTQCAPREGWGHERRLEEVKQKPNVRGEDLPLWSFNPACGVSP